MLDPGAQPMSYGVPNQAAAVNAPVAPWFQIEHHWRRVTEQQRWAT